MLFWVIKLSNYALKSVVLTLYVVGSHSRSIPGEIKDQRCTGDSMCARQYVPARRLDHSSQTSLTTTPQRILLFEQTISSRSHLIQPSACQLLDPPRYAAAALLAVITRTHLFISSCRQTEILSTQSSERVRGRGSHQTMSGRAHRARNPDGRHSRARTWPCGRWLENWNSGASGNSRRLLLERFQSSR